MSNLLTVILLGLTVSIVCFTIIIVSYRKFKHSEELMIARIARAEQELFDDLQQIEIAELRETSAGRELIVLLAQEYPELPSKLNRIEENEHTGTIIAPQEAGLSEISNIMAAIAEGWKENVNSLNAIFSSIQRIMDFKVTEAQSAQNLMQRVQRQLQELNAVQRQQVEGLLQSAIGLRHSHFAYTNPGPDLQRQLVEFRTQVDLLQRVILDRHTGAESPQAENRRYGEIYLRRGVIAYLDNDVVKSRQMLEIAERFFPFSQQEIASMPRDQKIQTAFTQFYLALIQKNYGSMMAARAYIEKSYTVYGRMEQDELSTTTTRAEILSYLGDMDTARAAIQEVLERADMLRQRGTLEKHAAIYALRARLLLGNIYYVRGEWDQALQHYQIAVEADVHQASYYAYHSIAQVYHLLGEEAEAKKNKRRAYEMLLETDHLRTKTAMDTRILLNALAYLCTREDEPEKAQTYRETIRELWLRIHEVNGLQLRLFSFEKKRLVSKDEFWDEIFGN